MQLAKDLQGGACETDILALIAEGLSNKEIARSLEIGPDAVKSHLKSVFTKLGAERRAQAVSRVQTLGSCHYAVKLNLAICFSPGAVGSYQMLAMDQDVPLSSSSKLSA